VTSAPAAYQSLYRRFRPQRFDEVLGQEHVSLALRNAVRDGRVSHAYLFSGPRGTGKTSTARILAKALDCAAPVDGEPCGVCDSCIDIARGSSMDVHELDAASHNGVDAMRELVARSALGTPGRWKVYIVDEVHMLSTAASNALLKTLEEPPPHVVFVLATTDAQKVLPTIRSRTQHFEFRLLGPELLAGLLRKVRDDASLTIADDDVESAVRRGRGSARDALSALDQIAAGGVVRDETTTLAAMADGLAERDPAAVLVEVARAVSAGYDAQRLAGELADYLRQGFLSVLSPQLVSITGAERERVEETARRMGLPALVRAMEALGRAVVDMRDTPDPRVHLEATLIRLAHPEMDDSPAALLERIDRIERAVSAGAGTVANSSPRTVEPMPAPPGDPPPRASRRGTAGPAPSASGGAPPGTGDAPPGTGAAPQGEPEVPDSPLGGSPGPELARKALSDLRGGSSRSPSASTTTVARVQEPPPNARIVEGFPTRDDLSMAWGDGLLASLPSRARVRFRSGRFVSAGNGRALFALPNDGQRAQCEDLKAEAEAVLASRFGMSVPLQLVVDQDSDDQVASTSGGGSRAGYLGGSRSAKRPAATSDDPVWHGIAARGSPVEGPEPDLLDRAVLEAETEPAGPPLSPEERIKLAFPGAQEV
jgi:DNA polymerase III subunit gamma/tau